jgi:hypothetical protein
MRIFKTKRSALLAVIGVLAVSAAAIAYWTSTGTGTGSGQAGTVANSVVLTGTVQGGTLAPGGPARTVTFTAANPQEYAQSVSSIHLVGVRAYPTAADRTAGTNVISGCTALAGVDFAMSDIPVNPATDGDIAPNAVAQAMTATGSFSMINRDVNQDSCKSAFLALDLTTA